MHKAIIGALLALLVSTLACSIFVGGPTYPQDIIPTPTGAPQTLQEQIQKALVAGATSGVISVQLTEDQLTSYLAQKVAGQSDPVITNPKVYLRAGQIQVFGTAQSGVFTANVSITLQASVDSEGQPHFDVTQTDLGPLAAPTGFNEALAASVEEAFTGWLGPVATGFRLQSISVGDGVMTVTGRIK